MIMVMCTVRDAKMDMFSRPFFVNTEAQAIRSFADEVNRAAEDNSYYKHPEDYALFTVGTFNDQNGNGEYHTTPKLLVHADQCIKKS